MPPTDGPGTTPADLGRLQTAAALENLLVATYSAMIGLDIVRDGAPGLLALARACRDQHADHADAFNTAIVAGGGLAQTGPEPTYLTVVRAAEPGLRTPAEVIALATRLEQVALRTLTRDASLAETPDLRALLLSVAVVEAQHAAALAVTGELHSAGLPAGLPAGPIAGTTLADLPAAAGSVGLTAAFTPTTGGVL